MLSLAAAAAAAPLRDPLWNQLAALPVLTFQAMEGRTGELVATVAEGVVESVQQHALGELSDSVVLALCADGTADFGRRLTKALESNRSAASLRAAAAATAAAAVAKANTLIIVAFSVFIAVDPVSWKGRVRAAAPRPWLSYHKPPITQRAGLVSLEAWETGRQYEVGHKAVNFMSLTLACDSRRRLAQSMKSWKSSVGLVFTG